MHGWDELWIAFAGIGGGLTGSIGGLASLVSYPALLAVGLPPVTANMTNTVSLVFSGVGSSLGSRPELKGQGPTVARFGLLALLGGGTGAALLLVTSSSVFAKIVPILVGLASLAVLARRDHDAPLRSPHSIRHLPVAVFVIACYGGYFGAAAGVFLLALLLRATGDRLARVNALKNVTMGFANAIAGVLFIAVGTLSWRAAIPLSLGFLIGSRIGPIIVRRSPPRVLRSLIALGGVGLAVHLGLDAYR